MSGNTPPGSLSFSHVHGCQGSIHNSDSVFYQRAVRECADDGPVPVGIAHHDDSFLSFEGDRPAKSRYPRGIRKNSE